jgi:hypothetical protein
VIVGSVLGAAMLGGASYYAWLQYRAADLAPPQTVRPAPQTSRTPAESPAAEPATSAPLPPPGPRPWVETIRYYAQLRASRKAPDQGKRTHSTAELIAAVDEALDAAADKLGPAVVIFPVVDGAGTVRPDGEVLAEMASLAAIYTPHRRLALSFPALRESLGTAGCTKPGAILGPDQVALCTAALETKLYVIPTLRAQDGRQELEVAFHGDGRNYPDRSFRHAIPAGELRTLPGLVARDLLGHLRVDLNDAEREALSSPVVRTDRELDYLRLALPNFPCSPNEEIWLQAFVLANPRCALAWAAYLHGSDNPERALQDLAKAQPPPACDRLLLEAARVHRLQGRAEEALLDILRLAPSHRDDAGYFATLARCATALGEKRLTEHLLERWGEIGTGYAHRLERGRLLIDWGWEARGEGWASTVTDEGGRLFQQRLGRARTELEQAVAANPSGVLAHVLLIRVARGLSLSPEYVEDHFGEVVRRQPHLFLAYSEKFEYLRPRWLGDADALRTFGEQCLETGDWESGIPPLCLAGIADLCSGLEDDGLIRKQLEAGKLWDLLRRYHREVWEHGSADSQALADNYLVRLGIIGGHLDDLLPAFQHLLAKGKGPDWEVFHDLHYFLLCRELVLEQA